MFIIISRQILRRQEGDLDVRNDSEIFIDEMIKHVRLLLSFNYICTCICICIRLFLYIPMKSHNYDLYYNVCI